MEMCIICRYGCNLGGGFDNDAGVEGSVYKI